MHYQVCRVENIESREFNSPLRNVFGELFLSNYFHQKISTMFKVKICYFDRNFGTRLTVTSLCFSALGYLSPTSAPGLVSWQAFNSISIFAFHLLWYSTVNYFSIIAVISLAFSSKSSKLSMLVQFISKLKFIFEARIQTKGSFCIQI